MPRPVGSVNITTAKTSLHGTEVANGFATSNLTSNHFLGRHQPSWITSNSVPAPLSPRLQRPQRASSKNPQSPHTVSPSRQDGTANVPVPTESRASATGIRKCHEHECSDSGAQTPMMQPDEDAGESCAEDDPVPQRASELPHVGSPGQSTSNAIPGPPSRVSNHVAPIVSSAEAIVAVTTSPVNHQTFSSDLPHHHPQLHPINGVENDVPRKRRSEGKNPDSGSHPEKRISGPSSLLPSLPADNLVAQIPPHPTINPAARTARRLAQLDQCTLHFRVLRKYGLVERERLAFLREASNADDEVFLILHQLSCTATLDRASGVESGFTPLEVHGFLQFEEAFLRPNQQLDREVLKTLADFPEALPVSQASNRWAYVELQIRSLLPNLAKNWDGLQNQCLERRIPPTAHELIMFLSIRSAITQLLLFVCVSRKLGDRVNSELAERLTQYFASHQQRLLDELSRPNVDLTSSATANSVQSFGQGYRVLKDLVLRQPTTSSANGRSFTHNQITPSANLADHAGLVLPIQNNQTHQPQQPTAYLVRDPTSNVVGTFIPSPVYAPQAREQTSAQSYQTQPTPVPAQPLQMAQAQSYQRPGPVAAAHQTANQVYGHGYPGPVQMDRHLHRHPTQTYATAHPYHPRPFMPSPRVNNAPRNITAPGPVYHQPPNLSPAQNLDYRGQAPESTVATRIATQPLIPGPGFTLGETVNPDSNRIALHHAYLRSPDVQKYDMDGKLNKNLRLYQYFESYKLAPQLLGSDCPYFTWPFDITAEDRMQLPVDVPMDAQRPDMMPQRILRNGHVLFRFRCIVLPQDLVNMDPSKWSVAFTKWPSCIYVSVNDVDLEIRRKSHHRRDLAIDMSSSVRQGLNQIAVSILRSQLEERVPFAVAIERVKVLDHATAFSMATRLDARDCLAAITNRLSPTIGSDDEVEMIGAHVSIDLTDPFTSKIFTVPVRGKDCVHCECFDLTTFLQSRTSGAPGGPTNPDEWRCPICKRDARPCSLVVDGFLEEVRLRLEASGQIDTRAILVHADGSWKPKAQEERRWGKQKGDSWRSSPPKPAVGQPSDGNSHDPAAEPMAAVPVLTEAHVVEVQDA